jgi:hypothetical protein
MPLKSTFLVKLLYKNKLKLFRSAKKKTLFNRGFTQATRASQEARQVRVNSAFATTLL